MSKMYAFHVLRTHGLRDYWFSFTVVKTAIGDHTTHRVHTKLARSFTFLSVKNPPCIFNRIHLTFQLAIFSKTLHIANAWHRKRPWVITSINIFFLKKEDSFKKLLVFAWPVQSRRPGLHAHTLLILPVEQTLGFGRLRVPNQFSSGSKNQENFMGQS